MVFNQSGKIEMKSLKNNAEFKLTDTLKKYPPLLSIYLSVFLLICRRIKIARKIEHPAVKYWEKWPDVIIAPYFSSKKDPRWHFRRKKDDYSYMRRWYESMQQHDLHGIIFHDRLSASFIKKYQTDKIIFIKCTVGFYSLNDERFFIYNSFLKNAYYRYVFLTDISDLSINSDPFDLINNNRDKCLFIGSEEEYFQDCEWIKKTLGQFGERATFFDKLMQQRAFKIYNAGIIGGERRDVLALLERMTNIFNEFCNPFNVDMCVLNYVLKSYYNDDVIFSGYPLNSRFKSYEKPSETKACFIHK